MTGIVTSDYYKSKAFIRDAAQKYSSMDSMGWRIPVELTGNWLRSVGFDRASYTRDNLTLAMAYEKRFREKWDDPPRGLSQG